jgi:putative ABC transport system permease protein
LTSHTVPSSLSGIGQARPIRVQSVTSSLFSVLGVKPALGRVFLPEEMQDVSQTVVISDSFWKRQFNGDPHVLGKMFDIQGMVSTVVGVMPPGFAPFYGDAIDLWQPVDPQSSRYATRTDHWLMPVARLKPGVTLARAQVEMDVIAGRLAQQYPATNKGTGKRVVPLHTELFGWTKQTLYPLFGAVDFVLLIACVNVANLLQSRTETRRKEYALRASLGAGRGRLIQQLLTESGLLALLGGVLGVALTLLGIALFRRLAGDFPNAGSIDIDARVLLFTLGVSLLTAILFGLLPAIQASRPDLNIALREGGGSTASASRTFARHSLAVSEVALAMVLLVGAGLMINTMLRLQQVNPGFDHSNVLTAEIELPGAGKYLTRVPHGDMQEASPRVTVFFQQVLEKLAVVPGVESAGLISRLPTRSGGFYSFSTLGHAAPPLDKRPYAGYDEVSPSVFSTLRIPLRKGRYLDERDTQSAPWAVVVNEAFVRRYFPNEDPLGQQLLLRYDPYPMDEERPRQIVGVVGDVKHFGMGREAPPFMYASHLQQPVAFPGGAVGPHIRKALVIRMASALHDREADLASAVRKAVAQLDPDAPVTNITTMDGVLEASVGYWQFYMRLLVIFAGMALLLALIGIYGVMSYFVSQRTHEFGIRLALGAKPADVLGLVAKLGLKLTSIGVVIGIGLAVWLTRLIARFLFGVKPTDPVTYLAVAASLISVALAACYIPAFRATKVDPMVALRHE